MAEWKERREERIGNTGERLDVPVGHFRPTPSGRAGFARPVRRAAWTMERHRAARLSCRSEQIRQRRGHAVTVHTA
jgi:hypothetical protein